ncbi:MAG: ABC transporter ATP-binding protein [Anaerolineales bacterium]
MAVIETIDLSRVYGKGEISVHALDDVNLSIERGEFVAVMGPSGSGKSTLMNILGCLDRPTKGRYILDSVEVSEMTRSQLAVIRNERIGFIFQSYNLLKKATALRNVMAPLLYDRSRKRTREEKEAKAREALISVGLEDRMEHEPTELSGGQQQRVAVARALVNDPAFILADEPTGNLDSRSGEEMMELFHELHRSGRTIVIVTHDASIAKHTQRSIHLQDGRIERIIENGSVKSKREVQSESV